MYFIKAQTPENHFQTSRHPKDFLLISWMICRYLNVDESTNPEVFFMTLFNFQTIFPASTANETNKMTTNNMVLDTTKTDTTCKRCIQKKSDHMMTIFFYAILTFLLRYNTVS